MNAYLLARICTTYQDLTNYLLNIRLKSSHAYFFFQLDVFQMLPQIIFCILHPGTSCSPDMTTQTVRSKSTALHYTVLTTQKFITDDYFLCRITVIFSMLKKCVSSIISAYFVFVDITD
jgi:hypothetical protein